VSAVSSFPGRATRVTVASFPERERSLPTRIAVHLPVRRKKERSAFRTEHEDGHAKGACDKKVARSELRVIVVLQRALDEPLNRALLGLGAHPRRAGGRLRRFGVFVVLGFASVAPDGDGRGRSGACAWEARCVRVATISSPSSSSSSGSSSSWLPRSGQAISAGHTTTSAGILRRNSR